RVEPLLWVRLRHGLGRPQDAGIVHQNIHWAEAFLDLFEGSLDVLRAGNVALQAEHVRQIAARARQGGHLCALAGECLRASPTHASASTSDQRHLAGEACPLAHSRRSAADRSAVPLRCGSNCIRKNIKLAGLSANRRMKYAYQSEPNGT